MINMENLRKLPVELQKLENQAVQCNLAFIRCHGLSSQLGKDAAKYIQKICLDKELKAYLEYADD